VSVGKAIANTNTQKGNVNFATNFSKNVFNWVRLSQRIQWDIQNLTRSQGNMQLSAGMTATVHLY